ncbi:MAG TPA: hypothetical protein V6C84_08105 [Coleofasciculaceae cyanobacterium]|jgi:hypothetical protein
MTILNLTPEAEPQIWELLQPLSELNLPGEVADLETADLLLNEAFEQFDLAATDLETTDLETDWEEIS